MATNPIGPSVTPFRGDTTQRLSVRNGDYLLWLVTQSIWQARSESAWTIKDFWQLRDGDSVVMSNRSVDVPHWINPQSLDLNGPNIWRVLGGDRLAWVRLSGASGTVREIFDFRCCALVLGESTNADRLVYFGAPDDGEPSELVASTMRQGFETAVRLGIPRTLSAEWRFGA